MKKTFTYISIAALTFGMAACGQKASETAENEIFDENSFEDYEDFEDDMFGEVYILNDQGIGPVELGMDIAKLPASVDGLYDSFTVALYKSEDRPHVPRRLKGHCDFVLDGKVYFRADFNDINRIKYISSTNPEFHTNVGVMPGMSREEVLAMPDVKKKEQLPEHQFHPDVVGAYELDGIYIYMGDKSVIGVAAGQFY